MADKRKELSDADLAKVKAQREKERAKREKQRERDRARQERDAKRYEKAAEAARKKAAESRAEAERLQNDPKYQAKQQKEAARLKAKGRKEMEKNRKRSAKKASKASKAREKQAKRDEKQGLAAVEGAGRRRRSEERKPSGSRSGSHEGLAQATSSASQTSAAVSKHRRNARISLVFMLLIAVGAAFMLWPPQDKITMGLDIQGGLSVNLTAATSDGGTPTSDQMDEARQVITSRVNSSGASAATVQTQGSNAFLVQVPGAEDSQSILETLSSQGVLEFVRVDQIESETVTSAIENGLWGMNLNEQNATYTSFMDGSHVTNTTVDRPQGSASYAVNLQLDSEGAQAFADTTKELADDKGKIAIVLDGVVKSAPAVQSAITDGRVQITGNYSSEEANNLKAIIDSGSLPVSLTVESSSVVGPTLGNSALMVGIISALIGLAVVIVWLLLFYKGLGLLTSAAVLIMSLVYLGLLAMLSQLGWFSLTLPGIAGIIVNIGMSADSSILIMECFHEQIRRGKSVKSASVSGVHEGIFTSIDADLVTLVSALVLYFVAVGDVRGFGLTLALGIMCDLLIMALFAGPIIRILGPGTIARHPGFWGTMDDVNEGAYLDKVAADEKAENAAKGHPAQKKARGPRGISTGKGVE